MREFEGKVAVVTGSGGGIASPIAYALAQSGASLALCDIRMPPLEQTASACRAAGATAVYAAGVDVSDEAQVVDFCATVSRQLHDADFLIHTVGVADCAGDVEELPTSVWERTLRVNLTSAFLIAKYIVPQMKRRGGGVIINLASVSGLANRFKAMAYSVSKAGLLSLTRSEAIDLAPHNIRVNAVSPGSVETELLHEAAVRNAKIFQRTRDEQWQFWLSQYPSGRFTQPQQVAELVLFLCSDRAANITGANYVIDGGLTALLPER
jgi:NAD(P)-dependent dehydrogenase (short-subunit alcohol dehydrogenase family)